MRGGLFGGGAAAGVGGHFVTALVHFHKQEHGQSANVYRLVGRREDALTYGLGHLMAIDDGFMLEILKELGVIARVRGRRYTAYRANYEIYLQEQRNVGGSGRRDIVVEAGGTEGLRVVIEAKIGAAQPIACQLLRYSVGCDCGNHGPDSGPDWGSRTEKFLVTLTRSPLDSSVRADILQSLNSSGIVLRCAQWHQILKVALDRQRQLDGRSSRSVFFSEFANFFRGYYEMDLYDAEVMVQDEDPENAPIYFNDYMYVGGRRWPKMPLYFAPYFTKSCVWNKSLPQVTTDGVSWVSKVEEVRQMSLDELRNNPVDAVDTDVKRKPHWKRWRRGLEDIRDLAIRKEWGSGSVWMYFLSEPAPLGRTIKKRKGHSRLVPGSKTTFLDLLTSDVLKTPSR